MSLISNNLNKSKLRALLVSTIVSALILQSANAQSSLPEATPKQAISQEQLVVLAELKRCPIDPFSVMYDCVLRKFSLRGNHIKYKKLRLSTIYSEYLKNLNKNDDELVSIGSSLDGYHRAKLFASVQPDNVVCNETEVIKIVFDSEKIAKRPISEKDMSLFIRRAHNNSIGKNTLHKGQRSRIAF